MRGIAMQIYKYFQETPEKPEQNVVSSVTTLNAEFTPIRELTAEEQQIRAKFESQFDYYEKELADRIYDYMDKEDFAKTQIAQAKQAYEEAVDDLDSLKNENRGFQLKDCSPLITAKQQLEKIGVEVDSEFNGFFDNDLLAPL
jgi:hypothetical protein